MSFGKLGSTQGHAVVAMCRPSGSGRDSSIGERRVQKHKKTLGWLGSSSAAGVFDSNGRD